MTALRPIASMLLVVAACAGNTPTASQSTPVAPPVDTVTSRPAAAAQPASPYGVAANGPIVYGEDGEIYSLDPATGTSSLLIGGPEVDVGPAYSRDGSRFSFVRVTSEKPERIALMIADADGSNVRMVLEPELVGERHWFEWSPLSDALVVANSADGVPPLSVVNVAGEPARRAVSVAAEVNVVDWRPGSDELIFAGRIPEASGSGRGLYVVSIDGAGLRELVPAPGSGTHTVLFSLSPDGRFLAYTFVDASGHVSSHILDLDSGDTRTLGGSSNQGWATFSPDGERLAVVRYALNGSTAQAYVGSAADGTDAVPMGPKLSNKPGHHGLRIQFSPDGTKLLIVRAPGGGGWIADVATGAYESVALGDDEWVSWRRLAP